MAAPREADIQRACLQYLHLIGWHVWRNNTGATRATDTRGKARFIRYGSPGSADILGVTPRGQFLAVELKRPGNKPTELQAEWLERVRKSGGLAIVATSLDELRNHLRQAGYDIP